MGDGSVLVLACAAHVPSHGVVVFAALLPRDQQIRTLTAYDANGDHLVG